jgi:hypothetical protein
MERKIFTIIFSFLSAGFLQAQTWNGSSSTDWNTPANWSTNAVPTSTGVVIIPVPGIITNWPVLPGNITIGRLTMNAGSQLNTNGFNIVFTSTGGISFTGATITNPGALNTSDFNIPGGGTSINGCTFNGNFSFQKTSPNQVFSEATTASNTWNGNTTFTLMAGEGLSLSSNFPSTFNGNLTINKPADISDNASADIFLAGGFVTGNFTLNYDDEARLWVGNPGVTIRVGGQLNMNINNVASSMQIHGLKNYTTGGTIVMNNIDISLSLTQDSLQANTVNITQTSNSPTTFDSNYIKAAFTFNHTLAVSNQTITVRNTIFDGDVNVTIADAIYADGNVQRCYYLGNATFNTTSGAITLSNSDTSWFYKNLTVNTASGLNIKGAKFVGSVNSIFEQLGTQPVSIGRLIMEKTGGATLTLNDSVTITTTATFTSGNIISSTGNELIFPNTISYTGASVASHVVGPVTKIGIQSFTFPVGGPVSYNPITMSAPVGLTSRFKAEYKNQNPSIDGYNTNNKAGSFGAALISNAGYWDVQRIIGATNVTLTLGFNTNPYQQYPVLANLKVAHWNGAQWDDHGNGGTTGTSANGTVVNSVPITSFSPFALAGITNTYFYTYSNPGPGPDGTPVKFGGTGGYPVYNTKQLPAGTYSLDSIYLIANASSVGFKLKDFYGVEKDDTTVTAPTAPVTYISANGNGTKNFTGWRHFVYMTDGSNNIMGAIKDNDLTLGNTTMTTYFSTANVATAPNGNIFLKRSFKITSQFAPVGTKRVRFYISKTEYNNLVAADPAAFPNGINSLTITKYTGPQEDSLFNPIPGGNAIIIPNSNITIADLGTMYSLDIDVTGFSGFYISGNRSNLSLCTGSTISLPSNISGATYQWQVDNGSGYTNISNGGVYAGVTTNTLMLSSIPGTFYGYKFMCVVNGGSFSQEYIIKITALWQGTVSNVWENTANWSCGVLPDANTDVTLNAGKPNFPQINSNVTVRTLTMNPGSSAQVNTGFTLTVLK